MGDTATHIRKFDVEGEQHRMLEEAQGFRNMNLISVTAHRKLRLKINLWAIVNGYLQSGTETA